MSERTKHRKQQQQKHNSFAFTLWAHFFSTILLASTELLRSTNISYQICGSTGMSHYEHFIATVELETLTATLVGVHNNFNVAFRHSINASPFSLFSFKASQNPNTKKKESNLNWIFLLFPDFGDHSSRPFIWKRKKMRKFLNFEQVFLIWFFVVAKNTDRQRI